MKTIMTADIISWKPCQRVLDDKTIPDNWSGTALDVLAYDAAAAEDRLWVVLREEMLSAKTLRLFAVSCAKEALSLVPNPDPRSIEAVNVAERFANGEATKKELETARSTAWSAAWSAAWAAASAAAWSIPWLAAARSASAAAWAETRSAAWAETRSAAWSAARNNQVNTLIKIIKENEKGS